MNLRERILSHLQAKDYVPSTKSDLAAALGLAKKERRALDYEMRLLLASGDIIRIKDDRFCIPHDADLVTGVIKFRQSGSAFVTPDAPLGGKKLPAIEIAAEDTGVAMHQDRVVVRLQDSPTQQAGGWRGKRPAAARPSDGPFGRVIRIQKRARETVVGALCKTRLFHYVVPDDPRFIHDIYVPDPAKSDVKPTPVIGCKVVVKLHEWEQRHVNPEGEIILNLGDTHEPQAELMAILHKYELNPEFPRAVVEEAKRVPATVQPRHLKGRLDMRDVFTFTIDPDDAKDFDDALSIERPDAKTIRIGIHIADVSTYVKPNSALDKEAQERGNSTYLVGTVIPMLPRELSNGICSLVEAEDRLTKSVIVDFAPGGRMKKVEFANSVIRSDKRLTYKQAYTLLKHDDLEPARELQLPPSHQTGSTGRPLKDLSERELRRLQEGIRELWEIASKLRAERMRKGSLDLDMEETKILVNQDGFADRLEKVVNDESHQLIEEFMLLANECVARELKRANLPCVYRVHEEPDEERLNELREYLATFEITVADLNVRSEMVKLLLLLKEHPQGKLLRLQVLRSLKKACYRPTADGHYGLNKVDYTHFTSPIRRYSDLAVHRVFAHYLVSRLNHDPLADETPRYDVARALSLSEHLSLTEVNSTEAERESIKVKLLEFFERELEKPKPTTFDALITETRNHGMFIELTESSAFGMVHVSTLKDDLYHLNPSGTALIGRKTRNEYKIGQIIGVQVHRVDRFKRQIDFKVGESRAAAQPSRSPKGRASKPAASEKPADRRRAAKPKIPAAAETRAGAKKAIKSRRNRGR